MRSRPLESAAAARRGPDGRRAQGDRGHRHHDGHGAAGRPQGRRTPAEGDSDRSEAFTLEDLGYDAQKPASTLRAAARRRRCRRSTARRSATPGSASSRTGTPRRSRASATATACGNRPAAPCCRSTRATSRTVTQWVAAVAPRELMPTILALQASSFRTAPESAPQDRRLTPQADRIQSYGIDLARALTGGHGLVWAAVEEGQPIPRVAHLRRRAEHARHRRAGHQPGPHGQGQPAEHAGVRDAPRQRRAGRGRQGLDRHARRTRSSGPARPTPTAWRSRRRCRCAARSAGTRTSSRSW